jgi:hypothetical protein
MARPKNPYKKIEIKVCVNPFLLDQIKYIAKENGISVNEVFTNIINKGILPYYRDVDMTSIKIKLLKYHTEQKLMYGIDSPVII